MTPTIPNSGRPDNGLTFKHGSYYVRYYTGKIQRIKTLGTPDIVEARKRRDEFYLTLEGAVAQEGRGRPRIAPPGMDAAALPDGVTYRKPWRVMSDGVSLGAFHTLGEAMGVWEQNVTEHPASTEDSQPDHTDGGGLYVSACSGSSILASPACDSDPSCKYPRFIKVTCGGYPAGSDPYAGLDECARKQLRPLALCSEPLVCCKHRPEYPHKRPTTTDHQDSPTH